ncbi:hypothetical protein ACHWQZ_G011462 [Mnemiopsis leidyi]
MNDQTFANENFRTTNVPSTISESVRMLAAVHQPFYSSPAGTYSRFCRSHRLFMWPLSRSGSFIGTEKLQKTGYVLGHSPKRLAHSFVSFLLLDRAR